MVTDKIANGGAAVSAALASVNWMAEISGWLQIVSTLAAIFAGLSATMYYVMRVREIRSQIKDVKKAVEQVVVQANTDREVNTSRGTGDVGIKTGISDGADSLANRDRR